MNVSGLASSVSETLSRAVNASSPRGAGSQTALNLPASMSTTSKPTLCRVPA